MALFTNHSCSDSGLLKSEIGYLEFWMVGGSGDVLFIFINSLSCGVTKPPGRYVSAMAATGPRASVVQQLDVLRWKDADSASAASRPGRRAGALQQVNDVATQEVEVPGLTGGVVTEGVSHTRFLDKDGAER
ncbi:unnamed protein product [Pleuronectes platessa]|uniref:Uncharacterized protein n=1 Tax=Pleuronectes platessa TaxID=8262 RepID=A0A9N7UPF0_PLEPL|nr:unnamed protein product [Pleuronectes platessa]